MSSESEHEAVLATLKTMSDAWALMDAARFAACYANDAAVIGPGSYLRARTTSAPAWLLRLPAR